jgi:ATP-dependent helicase HrpB
MTALPVESIRDAFLNALPDGPVVLSAPTGSGKSTQVPRWCGGLGRVLVMEPRRVACRSLAQRVAELEEVTLGKEVGYHVRDERRATDKSHILFATPGIVLRLIEDRGISSFDVVILDEFHERSLDTDLVLALLRTRYSGHLVVMSATIQGPRLAAHLNGTHIHAEGRLFPVHIGYEAGNALLPTVKGLEDRLWKALRRVEALEGDVLVFLPGKGEIIAAARAIGTLEQWAVLPLHGGLTLKEQSRIFRSSKQRRVILATNVAETSITVPGVRVVIDSGLVRRTRYHQGRGYLTLGPIANDSAEQRSGRAGRLSDGDCIRLWSPKAILTEQTPPEILRESLVPLVLGAVACGVSLLDLGLYEQPRPYAVDTAKEVLQGLGAINAQGGITNRGKMLFKLPLDAAYGRLLVEAEAADCLQEMIDLVSALCTRVPFFIGLIEEDDPRNCGCDGLALIKAVRMSEGMSGVNPAARREARETAARLRSVWRLAKPEPGSPVDRLRLAEIILKAWPTCGYLKRQHKTNTAWRNGHGELTVERSSALLEEKNSVCLVLASRAMGVGLKDTRVKATYVMPVSKAWLAKQNIGLERVGSTRVERTRVICRIEKTYANQVIGSREDEPQGDVAREALAKAFLAGQIDAQALKKARKRWSLLVHAARLAARGLLDVEAVFPTEDDYETWLHTRLGVLGVERGADLALLSPEDFLPPHPGSDIRRIAEEVYPLHFSIGSTHYDVEYDFGRREATFVQVSGSRKEPPALSFLPPLRDFRILVRQKSRVHILRA